MRLSDCIFFRNPFLLGMCYFPCDPKIVLDHVLTILICLFSTFYCIVVCDFKEGTIKLTGT